MSRDRLIKFDRFTGSPPPNSYARCGSGRQALRQSAWRSWPHHEAPVHILNEFDSTLHKPFQGRCINKQLITSKSDTSCLHLPSCLRISLPWCQISEAMGYAISNLARSVYITPPRTVSQSYTVIFLEGSLAFIPSFHRCLSYFVCHVSHKLIAARRSVIELLGTTCIYESFYNGD